MFKKLFLFYVGFVHSVITSESEPSMKYILVPKEHHNIKIDNFNSEHNINHLATFDDITFYTTTQHNFKTFENTLKDLFYVEEDQIISINNDFVIVKNNNNFNLRKNLDNVPWHLDRIARHSLPLNNSFPYSSSGSCHTNKDIVIDTYVVDTGIDVNHPEFEGRATWLANFADNENTDCNSHGTHCAGLIGSKTYGSCKDANLYAVKVLDCNGSGALSGVIKGIEYAYKRHKEQESNGQNVRSILSMSLGGGFSRAINMAVENCVKNSNTFYFTVAAGNENQDACQTSPASAKGIITVMASDKFDDKAYFSNFGRCATMYSPGVEIQSTIPGGKTAVYSGTSMATPVLAGVLNHYLDQFPDLNLKKIKSKMLKDASKNVLSGSPKGTKNALVYLHR